VSLSAYLGHYSKRLLLRQSL